MDFQFLKSNRFWALVLVGVVMALKSWGLVDEGVAGALMTVLLGFVGVRTIDRVGEKFNG